MSTLTLELPEALVARLGGRSDANELAVEAITDALQREAEQIAQSSPLRPFSAYASESEYVAAAARAAQTFGVESDLAASLAAGIADAEMGRTLSLTEAQAEWATKRTA